MGEREGNREKQSDRERQRENKREIGQIETETERDGVRDREKVLNTNHQEYVFSISVDNIVSKNVYVSSQTQFRSGIFRHFYFYELEPHTHNNLTFKI